MGLLYAESLPICERISVVVPSVGYIIDHEIDYYDAVCSIVATPYDMMVQLDDAGADFTQITDFELFLILFARLRELDTSMIFGSLDLKKFKYTSNTETGEPCLRDDENDITIDSVVYESICSALRKMLRLTKNDKKPGNEEAKKYLLKRARQRLKRRKNEERGTMLEDYIVALVNTEQFPYNYKTVRDISIIQFYASLNQISHKIKFDNTMVGYYAGTVKLDDISESDRSWILNT